VIIDDRADNEPRSLPEAAPANRWKMGTADISDVIAALKQWLDARAPRHKKPGDAADSITERRLHVGLVHARARRLR
jgi:hypothetical protein